MTPSAIPLFGSPFNRRKLGSLTSIVSGRRSEPPVVSGADPAGHTLGRNHAVTQLGERLRDAAGQREGNRAVHERAAAFARRVLPSARASHISPRCVPGRAARSRRPQGASCASRRSNSRRWGWVSWSSAISSLGMDEAGVSVVGTVTHFIVPCRQLLMVRTLTSIGSTIHVYASVSTGLSLPSLDSSPMLLSAT